MFNSNRYRGKLTGFSSNFIIVDLKNIHGQVSNYVLRYDRRESAHNSNTFFLFLCWLFSSSDCVVSLAKYETKHEKNSLSRTLDDSIIIFFLFFFSGASDDDERRLRLDAITREQRKVISLFFRLFLSNSYRARQWNNTYAAESRRGELKQLQFSYECRKKFFEQLSMLIWMATAQGWLTIQSKFNSNSMKKSEWFYDLILILFSTSSSFGCFNLIHNGIGIARIVQTSNRMRERFQQQKIIHVMSWTCVQWNSSSPCHRRHCNMSNGSMETNFMLWHGKEQKTENGSLSSSRVYEMLCWINNITQGRAHREQSKTFYTLRCSLERLLEDWSERAAQAIKLCVDEDWRGVWHGMAAQSWKKT